MLVSFSQTGIDAFDRYLERYLTCFGGQRVKQHTPLVILEAPNHVGINMGDPEIKIGVIPVNVPGRDLGRCEYGGKAYYTRDSER